MGEDIQTEMKSVWCRVQEAYDIHKTRNNTYDIFPVGARVMVITPAQDFYFFKGNETGTVVKNTERYLGIMVEFDEPMHFTDGHIQARFNFEPIDLIRI